VEVEVPVEVEVRGAQVGQVAAADQVDQAAVEVPVAVEALVVAEDQVAAADRVDQAAVVAPVEAVGRVALVEAEDQVVVADPVAQQAHHAFQELNVVQETVVCFQSHLVNVIKIKQCLIVRSNFMYENVRNRGNSAFTIVELSVVLLVIALILGTSLSLGASQAEVQRISQTNQKLNSIQLNLQSYLMGGGTVVTNGLPCPADPSQVQTAALFGVASTAVPNSAPASSTCTIAAGSQVLYIGTANATGKAYIGALPNRTLLLPDEYQVDGWDNKFAYVMNAAYNSSTNLANLNYPYPAITVNSTGGAVCVAPGTTANCLTNDAAIAVISYGHSSYGAWTRKGASRIATGWNGGADNDQIQNVICDGTYITSHCTAVATSPATFVAKAANSNYDQITRYMARWQLVYSPIAGGRVVTSYPDCNRPLPAATNTDPTINSGNAYLYQCGTGAGEPGYIAPNHCVPMAFVTDTSNGDASAGLIDYDITGNGTFNDYNMGFAADMGGFTPSYLCMAPDGNQVICAATAPLLGTSLAGQLPVFDNSNTVAGHTPPVTPTDATYSTYAITPNTNSGSCYWLQY